MTDRILIALLVMAAGVAAYLLLQTWQRRKASLAIAAAPSAESGIARPTILYFRSDHCAPCVTQSRFLDQLAGQLGDALAIRKIDADAEPDLAAQFGVFTVPTTLVVDAAGQVRHANYGLADAGKLAAQVRHQGEILNFDI
jgi:thiol-disulfide isomerase/thioredoxin